MEVQGELTTPNAVPGLGVDHQFKFLVGPSQSSNHLKGVLQMNVVVS